MNLLYYFIVLVFLLLSACGGQSDEKSMTSIGGKWTCNIEKQYQCSRDGCNPRDPRIKIIIDFDNDKFSRCTLTACDSYVFESFEDPLLSVLIGKMDRARGAHFVVDIDGTNFVESVSQGAWTNSSFGNCEQEIMEEK
jgi:hypothetical protein